MAESDKSTFMGFSTKAIRGMMQGWMYMYYNRPKELRGKTIQKGYRFVTMVLPNDMYFKRLFGKIKADRNSTYASGGGKVLALADTIDLAPFESLMNGWYVKNATLPSYKVGKESQSFGVLPKTYPVFGMNDGDAIEPIVIDFEEDEWGTIEWFINWAYTTIINKNGTHVPPNLTKMFNIVVMRLNDDAFPTDVYVYRNCYYMGTGGDLRVSYDDTGATTRTIKFGTDRISYFNPKYAIHGLASEAVDALSV